MTSTLRTSSTWLTRHGGGEGQRPSVGTAVLRLRAGPAAWRAVAGSSSRRRWSTSLALTMVVSGERSSWRTSPSETSVSPHSLLQRAGSHARRCRQRGTQGSLVSEMVRPPAPPPRVRWWDRCVDKDRVRRHHRRTREPHRSRRRPRRIRRPSPRRVLKDELSLTSPAGVPASPSTAPQCALCQSSRPPPAAQAGRSVTPS